MQILQYCFQSRTKLDQIRKKQMPVKGKVMLLQSLKQKLKQIHEYQVNHQNSKQKLDLSTTFFTETKSIINKQEQDNLIDQILKKQRIKIEIDQQIQTCEDDLNQIEKTVETKQAYSEELTQRIAQKSRQLEENAAKETKLQKVKSTPSLLRKIFG